MVAEQNLQHLKICDEIRKMRFKGAGSRERYGPFVKEQRFFKIAQYKTCVLTGCILLRHACQLASVQSLQFITLIYTFQKL